MSRDQAKFFPQKTCVLLRVTLSYEPKLALNENAESLSYLNEHRQCDFLEFSDLINYLSK